MAEIYKPEPYQVIGTRHIKEHDFTGLFMEMGLGKTVVSLTAFVELKAEKRVRKALVIAPLKVARDTWSDEIEKWEHTKHLRVSKILGNVKERLEAIRTDADIYTINCENVKWLIALMQGKWPWDWVIIDELSKFKSAKSNRFKALRTARPKFKRVTGLTGTPRPNGLHDLWSQLYLLDQGERLGKTLTEYRHKYFEPDKQKGHVVYSYKVKKEDNALIGEEIYAQEIYDKIGDICLSMRAKDYIKLPDKVMRPIEFALDPDVMLAYQDFEKELIMEIADKEVTVANAAVLTGKLLQFANGAIYDDERNWHKLHDEKLDKLADIIDEAQGDPIMVFYNYKHDMERIMKRFKGMQPRVLKTSQDFRDWNVGKVPLALLHPKSGGHGLNLQMGGNIVVWFGMQWSLELFDQAIARLHRRGQARPVFVYLLMARGTMDGEVLKSLQRKHEGQSGAMKALRGRMAYYQQAA